MYFVFTFWLPQLSLTWVSAPAPAPIVPLQWETEVSGVKFTHKPSCDLAQSMLAAQFSFAMRVKICV